MEEEKKDHIIEICPLGKWKRLLAFFADYFLALIISFTLFNLLVFPVAKIACNTQKKSEEAIALEQKAINLLIDDGFLFSPNDGASFEDDVNYTFKVFLSYYAYDTEEADVSIKQYGHKQENEVIRKYYQNVIKDTDAYLTAFKKENSINQMFEIGDTIDSIVLKNDYKIILANELLEQTDESKYSVTMTNFRDNVFARLFYLHVYDHIQNNDYIKDGVSFKKCYEEVRDINKGLQWVATSSAFIATFLGWSVPYLIYPLFNSNKKTIGLSMMHVSKLSFKDLGEANNTLVLIRSFYYLVFFLGSALFLPVLYFGLSYVFNLPLLFIFTIISAVLTIISGIFIFINEHNRSGSDILTNTVLMMDSEIDRLYQARSDNG